MKRTVSIIAVLTALSWGQAGCGAGQEIPRGGPNTEADLSGRLKIYRATLLQGPDEQIRIEAAIELLLAEDKPGFPVLHIPFGLFFFDKSNLFH